MAIDLGVHPIEFQAVVNQKCDRCGKKDAKLGEAWAEGSSQAKLRLCWRCLGQWVETATGWHVNSTFYQWDQMSRLGAKIRAGEKIGRATGRMRGVK